MLPIHDRLIVHSRIGVTGYQASITIVHWLAPVRWSWDSISPAPYHPKKNKQQAHLLEQLGIAFAGISRLSDGPGSPTIQMPTSLSAHPAHRSFVYVPEELGIERAYDGALCQLECPGTPSDHLVIIMGKIKKMIAYWSNSASN